MFWSMSNRSIPGHKELPIDEKGSFGETVERGFECEYGVPGNPLPVYPC